MRSIAKVAPLIGLLLLIDGSLSAVRPPHARRNETITPSEPLLSISQTDFPASKTCRLGTRSAHLCDDGRYASFTLGYTVPEGTFFTPGAQLRIHYAYKYGFQYRTESVYTEHYSWPMAQSSDPEGANYMTASVTDNTGGSLESFALELTHNTQERMTYLKTSYIIAPGARIIVNFGDRSGGGPGHVVPAVAYDIDLLFDQDDDADGNFDLVTAEVPTLRVVGADLDEFEVLAPSTPESRTFEIVVNALQGKDEPMTNQYLVRNYHGTIRFTSTDPDADLPDDYTFQEDDGGSRGFFVTLPSAGQHTVTVQEVGSSQTGTSNTIVVGKEFGPSEKRIYWGVLQQHTNIGGHAAQTPQFAFDYGKYIANLDFLALTEHCKPHFDFDYSASVADAYYEPGEFVSFAAIEWSNREFGHRHIIYRHSNGVALCNSPGNSNSIYIPNLAQLFLNTEDKDELIIVHHSAWRYTEPFEASDDMVLGNRDNPNQRLFEIYSRHGSSEKWDNAPYIQHGDIKHQWPASKKVFFQDALARGYRFGVTSGTDNHTGEPGGHVAIAGNYARLGVTAVLADELTRDGLWEALWARRTYGTTGERIILDFRIDGHLMGEEFWTGEPPVITGSVIGTDTIELIQIQRNGYDTVFELRPDAASASFEFIDDTVEPAQEYSYYMRVVQSDQHMAWSSPIWVGKAGGFTPPSQPRFGFVALYPNPFNPTVTIRFRLPVPVATTIEVWTVDGRRVATLVENHVYDEGDQEIVWDGLNGDGSPAASGVYFVRITTTLGAENARAVLLR